jgi:hypothetical protein
MLYVFCLDVLVYKYFSKLGMLVYTYCWPIIYVKDNTCKWACIYVLPSGRLECVYIFTAT